MSANTFGVKVLNIYYIEGSVFYNGRNKTVQSGVQTSA